MASSLALLLAGAVFARWSFTSAWAFPRFLDALALLVYLPGRALLGRPATPALDQLALALGLGVPAATLCFRGACLLGHPRLVWLAVPAAVLVLVLRRQRPWATAPAGRHHPLLVAVLVLTCLPFALVPMYYRNLDRQPGGDLTYATMPDAVLHLSLAHQLTVRGDVEVPFLPGRPLHYHHGMDLLAALLATGTGLEVADLTVRFVPTFLMALLTLAAFCLGRAWVRSGAAGLAVALLVPLGEDLAWIPGLLRGEREPWAIQFLGMPNVVSLYGLNPLLPAMALLLLGLLSLLAYTREGGRAWLWRCAVLLAAVADYKVFAAAQALGALGLAGVLHAVLLRERRPLRAFALTALVSLPFVAAAAGGGPAAMIRLAPWPYVPAALIRSGLWDTWMGRGTDALLTRGSLAPGALAAFFGLALPLYLLAVFGARWLGLPALLRALRPRAGDAVRLAAAAFVLAGAPLALLVAITPATYEPRARYNEAAWFLVQAKMVAWLFAVQQVFAWARGRARVALSALAAVAALSLPSTVQYFRYQASIPQLRLLGPDEMDLLRFLDRETPPGTIVLARPEIATATLALTRARAPVFTIHPFYFVSSGDLRAHVERLAGFWTAWRAGTVLTGVAASYSARLVVADLAQDGPAPPGAPLRPLYGNGRYAVYALEGAPVTISP